MKKEELISALRKSECLISATELKAIYDRLATELNLYYYGLNPIVLIILNGGLIPAGQLLPRLNFFARIGYLHATRYEENEGRDLHWKARPSLNIAGEDVLLIDDIFDEGITLKNVYEELLESGSVLLAWRQSEGEAQFLGALHQTVDNKAACISHVAVKEEARGHHVGQALLDARVGGTLQA